jgi:hypothetical protein
MREDGKIDIVLGKALSILGHAELIEPFRNLRHRRPCTNFASIQSRELSSTGRDVIAVIRSDGRPGVGHDQKS